jgi:Kef-type K+ transport system membrane component KefB
MVTAGETRRIYSVTASRAFRHRPAIWHQNGSRQSESPNHVQRDVGERLSCGEFRLGAVRLEPVVVAIGATVVSDSLSLIVFAICVSTYTSGFSVSGLTIQFVEILIFVPFILIGLSRAGAYILSRVRDSEEVFFVTMLGIMALAGLSAELINLPEIVGAFLAGLSVNAAVQDHPAKAKLVV